MAEKEQSRSGRRFRAKDARRRTVTLLDPYVLHLLRRHEIIPAETLRAIAEEVGPGVTKRRYLAFWVCPICVVLFLAIVVTRKLVIGVGFHFDAVERLLWPLNLTLISVSAFMMWRSSRATRFKRVRNVMLKHRRCPHCGYDLRGLPADPGNQATVCPECGSAWQLAEGARAVSATRADESRDP